ncbi:MAG TPA: methylated-DNA--[protein]-cysteine S-methyltransferase [Nitrospirae bacterium]|nr:methylated-DNA--protein-cysteine methyltransferase [bacterium BMS3Abin06]HDH12674.1 methylated-DNA--[protein]-cysteine S-methyltransferase [Nitrospirota bacterium]HDY99982.1 methylated-DNA--[protein]-cysteine S-methyltransferase [Nitrospirota bacterium]
MSQAVNRSTLFYDIFKSPLGSMYLIFSGKFLSGISFTRPSDIPFKVDSAPENFIKELTLYFQGSDTHFSQEIKFLTGTDFEKKVWSALKEIPFGETRTYKWIAEKTGKPSAARAVGRALSKNPIPVVIPCHRIIESDGSIGGYSSGVNRKIRLLEMEYYSKR